ncbi:hypothetical protein J2Z23_003167 [Lederbergia galactosidilyticus]|nr:hypothetical protein [Lederbergia galactosidilytica]
MRAFWGLLKKDLILLRFWSCVWLICVFLGMVAGLILANKMGDLSLIVPMYVFVMSAQILFIPIMLIYILNLEGKTQMWLYNPQSSWKLILSKLVSVTCFQLISQLLLLVYGFIFLQLLMSSDMVATSENLLPINLIAYFILSILAVSVYFGVLMIFYWTIYHALAKFPRIQRFRWLVLVGIWIGWNTLETFVAKILGKTPIFSIGLQVNPVPSMHYDNVGKNWSIVHSQGDFTIPITIIFVYLLVAIILLFVSSRLLDKKVEV